MAFISEKTNKNAQKCQDCAFKQLKGKIDKNSVLHEEAEIAVDGLLRLSCNLCPNKEAFVKVYGVPPYEYFVKAGKS
ncbi:MAG: hypothetical protein JXA20_18695 [Spirochaetes bacterium]|nr:hypothetical protein [Spirochaetota bacterium]